MSYLAAIFVVGLVIAIHELGHLLAAKWCAIPVVRFSIGFGPKLFGFTYKGTAYWLSAVPIGGYVLPAVEEGESLKLPLGKAILFAVGGPMANVISAYTGLAVLGGLQFGLTGVDALAFATARLSFDLQQSMQAIAIMFAGGGQISGIVGIVAIGGSQFGSSLAGLLAFGVAISVSLATLNLLPFPPLDGGRIAFAVVEKIYRPFARLQTPVALAGWAIMLALMAYATVQDIGRLGVGFSPG